MSYIAGLGFRNSATVESLLDAYRRASSGMDGPITALATAQEKASHPAMIALCETLGLPLQVVEKRDLVAQEVRSHSETSLKTYQTPSVAEASALAAAGPSSYLAATRVISSDRLATCAIATRAQ